MTVDKNSNIIVTIEAQLERLTDPGRNWSFGEDTPSLARLVTEHAETEIAKQFLGCLETLRDLDIDVQAVFYGISDKNQLRAAYDAFKTVLGRDAANQNIKALSPTHIGVTFSDFVQIGDAFSYASQTTQANESGAPLQMVDDRMSELNAELLTLNFDLPWAIAVPAGELLGLDARAKRFSLKSVVTSLFSRDKSDDQSFVGGEIKGKMLSKFAI